MLSARRNVVRGRALGDGSLVVVDRPVVVCETGERSVCVQLIHRALREL
jgi:hypothetical protein